MKLRERAWCPSATFIRAFPAPPAMPPRPAASRWSFPFSEPRPSLITISSSRFPIRSFIWCAMRWPTASRGEDRYHAGKSEIGKVAVRAYPRGNHIFIEVEDDGHGIDFERVRGTAVQAGLVSAEEEIGRASCRERV